MTHARLAVIALCGTLAACGGSSTPPAAEKPPAPAPAVPAPAPEPPKPAVPAPPLETPKFETPLPEPPKPPVRATKDASGQDWTSHMGDIPFALDPVAAMDAAAKANRPLMLYFTSPG
jgi:hypothetical protein